MEASNRYQVLGVMSGTSLDGLDITYCQFEQNAGWHFQLLAAQTFGFPDSLRNQLQGLMGSDLYGALRVEQAFDEFLVKCVKAFSTQEGIDLREVDLLANHGQTIFHEPESGFTYQLSNPSRIASLLRIPVVGDFRTADVALGGQGAPLVPIGDALLFGEFDACINLGGFANVSLEIHGNRRAWDICPVNFVMNPLARQLGGDYDDRGEWARGGELDADLLQKLESLAYYRLPYPKSLGAEWVQEHVGSLMERGDNPGILLRTWVEHAAMRISADLSRVNGKALFTGGGVKNTFLMERIQALSEADIVIPDAALIDFKEAIVFGFLGVLRWRGGVNCLSSVTGASKDHSAGVIALP